MKTSTIPIPTSTKPMVVAKFRGRRVEIFRGKQKKWYWRTIRIRNGQQMAEHGQGYSRHVDMVSAINFVFDRDFHHFKFPLTLD